MRSNPFLAAVMAVPFLVSDLAVDEWPPKQPHHHDDVRAEAVIEPFAVFPLASGSAHAAVPPADLQHLWGGGKPASPVRRAAC